MQFVCTNKLPQMHSIPSAWIYSSSQNFLNISTRQKSMQCYGVVVAVFFSSSAYFMCNMVICFRITKHICICKCGLWSWDVCKKIVLFSK